MKVDFADCEFGCFEPHHEIEFKGKTYRAIDVTLTLNDGSVEQHIIAEKELENALFADSVMGYMTTEAENLDNQISFYCKPNDGIYYVLEEITGEEMN